MIIVLEDDNPPVTRAYSCQPDCVTSPQTPYCYDVIVSLIQHIVEHTQ